MARPPAARFGHRFSNSQRPGAFLRAQILVVSCAVWAGPVPASPGRHGIRHEPPGFGPRNQCSSKMPPFSFCQGLFSSSSQSITVFSPHPESSIPFWGRCKTFAEGRPQGPQRSRPRAAPWAIAGDPAGHGSAPPWVSPRPPAGAKAGPTLFPWSGRSGAPRGRQPEERLGARAGARARRCRLGPPSLSGAPTVSGSRRNQSG